MQNCGIYVRVEGFDILGLRLGLLGVRGKSWVEESFRVAEISGTVEGNLVGMKWIVEKLREWQQGCKEISHCGKGWVVE